MRSVPFSTCVLLRVIFALLPVLIERINTSISLPLGRLASIDWESPLIKLSFSDAAALLDGRGVGHTLPAPGTRAQRRWAGCRPGRAVVARLPALGMSSFARELYARVLPAFGVATPDLYLDLYLPPGSDILPGLLPDYILCEHVTADLWIPLQTHPIARKLSNLIFFPIPDLISLP